MCVSLLLSHQSPSLFPAWVYLAEIERVENLECLTCLTKLNLLGNRLGPAPDSLCGLARLTCLRELDLSDNSM